MAQEEKKKVPPNAACTTRSHTPQSIVHNGYEYKSLADHDRDSTTVIDEWNKLYNLDPAWHLCPKTPDALHVCGAYPWAARALVLADGSAYYTALAPSANASLKPGASGSSFIHYVFVTV